MNKLVEMAREAIDTRSKVMTGRKLTTDEIIVTNANGVHIVACDIIDNGEDHYGVVQFVEFPDAYYTTGKALTKIIDKWVESYNNNIDTLNDDLTRLGGVKITLEKTTTKKGRSYVTVGVLSE